MLDSFPPLYRTGQAQPRSLSIRAALTKTSMMSEWVRNLDTTSRIHFGVDEREVISDELQQIAAAYQSDNYSDDESDD